MLPFLLVSVLVLFLASPFEPAIGMVLVRFILVLCLWFESFSKYKAVGGYYMAIVFQKRSVVRFPWSFLVLRAWEILG